MSSETAQVSRLQQELAQVRRELVQQQRLAALGRAAVKVARETHDRVTTANLQLRLLRRRLSSDQGSLDVVTKIESGLAEISLSAGDLLQFTADRPLRPERVRVRQLIDEVCATHEPRLLSQGIQLAVDVPSGETVLADRDLLRRSVHNLVLNAVDAMPDGGELMVTSYSGPGGFELEVADSGPGIDAELRRRAFEPFYSTKPGNTGLGLAVVARILAAHGGRVSAQNCPEGGAAFTLTLPRRAWEAAA